MKGFHMTRKLCGAILCLGVALGGSGALAEGWSVTNFDSVPDRATCMAYAETAVNTYRQRYNTPGFTGRSDWTLGGYDLRGDAVDSLFICADEGGLVSPFLVIYNTDDDNAARETISDRLADIFDEVVAGGGVPSGGAVTK
jgi:hypothetical protein